MSVLSSPPIAVLALELRDKLKIKTLVETGTHKGESTAWAARHFNQVLTIEIRDDYQAEAKQATSQYENIEFLSGDTRERLPEIVSKLTGPALFWLDAHSVTGLFGPEDDCPILEELDAISRSEFHHCVLIDDLHCFVPPLPHDATKWPEAWEIYQRASNHGYLARTGHDIIALVPIRARSVIDRWDGGAPPSFEDNQVHAHISADSMRMHRNLAPIRPMKAMGKATVGEVTPPEEGQSYTEIVRTAYGTMLVPRYDTNQTVALRASGYGLDHERILSLMELIKDRKGEAVFVDVGANVGAFGFAFRPLCSKVFLFEAQRIIFNMICGSIAINGWQNVYATNVVLAEKLDKVEVPQFDYNKICSFGSIEFGPAQLEPLHQIRTADPKRAETIPTAPLDYFHFPRIDLIKIDVEGYEIKVLGGAEKTLASHRPIIDIEHIKVNKMQLAERLIELEYEVTDTGENYLCFPKARSH